MQRKTKGTDVRMLNIVAWIETGKGVTQKRQELRFVEEYDRTRRPA